MKPGWRSRSHSCVSPCRQDSQLPQLQQGIAEAVLADLEDERLGSVDGGRHLVGRVEAELGDLARGGDEAPEERVLLDDLGVGRRVGRGRG